MRRWAAYAGLALVELVLGSGIANYLKTMRTFSIVLVALLAIASFGSAQSQTNGVINLPAHPFGVAGSRDQQWVFVSLLVGEKSQGPGLAVLRNQAGHLELLRIIPTGSAPSGLVLTHDGKTLIVAAGDSVVFLDTHRLETGASDPLFQRVSDGPGSGSIYANVTADDQTLFVSDEDSQSITVIDLARIRSLSRDSFMHWHRRSSARGAAKAIIGKIPVGIAPIALTFSKDERWLFTTSEVASTNWGWPRVLERENRKRGQDKVPEGAVIVIDVAKAKTQPQDSVVARVPAGGSPVRSVLSPDGRSLYVSARNSNALLVFDTEQLINDPTHAQPQKIPVGTSPVPVVLVQNGKLALVGNSNRFSAEAEKSSTLTVLDTARIGSGLDPRIGEISCGAFPREFHLTDDGQTLFLTNFRSQTLQIFDVARLTPGLEK
jgi:DNA-binding beta-propeller fold protein YncE